MNYLVAADSFFSDSPGGSGRVAWELACAMRDAGHTVGMVCGSSAEAPPLEVVEGVAVARYRYPRLFPLDPRRLNAHEHAAAQACQCLAGTKWDVAHGHTLASAAGVFGMARSRARVFTIHSPVVSEQQLNWANGTVTGWVKRHTGLGILARRERNLLDRADIVTALSAYTVQTIAAQYGSEMADRIRVLPGWSSITPSYVGRDEARSALGWPLDARIVFSLRRLVPRMGLETLIDATSLLRDHHRALTFIGGDGPARAHLERRVADFGLGGIVRFTGRLTDDEVRLAYRAADVFVVPSRALECFGLIVLEALASGCPTVASRVGALPEVLEPFGQGFLFEAGDARSLADAVERVFRNPPSDVACRKYVDSRFERRAVIERYIAMITAAAE